MDINIFYSNMQFADLKNSSQMITSFKDVVLIVGYNDGFKSLVHQLSTEIDTFRDAKKVFILVNTASQDQFVDIED